MFETPHFTIKVFYFSLYISCVLSCLHFICTFTQIPAPKLSSTPLFYLLSALKLIPFPVERVFFTHINVYIQTTSQISICPRIKLIDPASNQKVTLFGISVVVYQKIRWTTSQIWKARISYVISNNVIGIYEIHLCMSRTFELCHCLPCFLVNNRWSSKKGNFLVTRRINQFDPRACANLWCCLEISVNVGKERTFDWERGEFECRK